MLSTNEPRWSPDRRRPAEVITVILLFTFPLILSIRSVARPRVTPRRVRRAARRDADHLPGRRPRGRPGCLGPGHRFLTQPAKIDVLVQSSVRSGAASSPVPAPAGHPSYIDGLRPVPSSCPSTNSLKEARLLTCAGDSFSKTSRRTRATCAGAASSIALRPSAVRVT